MAPQVPATETVPRGEARPAQVLRRVKTRWMALSAVLVHWSSARGAALARRSIAVSAALAVLAALASLTAVGQLHADYGPAVLWVYPTTCLPLAWAIAVMTYTLLRPDVVAGDGRHAVAARWLRWSTLAALLIRQIGPLYYYHWIDAMGLSGWLVLLIGLDRAGSARGRLRLTLARLSDRGILSPPKAVEDLRRDLENTSHGWTATSSFVVAIALLVTSPPALLAASRSASWRVGLVAAYLAFLIIAGAVAGSWLGRMASYARVIGRALREKKVELRLVPGHPDGAVGLKPVGDFLLYQSLTASLPAIFLGTWLLLLSLGDASRLLAGDREYVTQYVWLLPLAMLFEILVFVGPMSSIHTAMRNQKQNEILPLADRLSRAIATDWDSLYDPANEEQNAARRQQATVFAEQYQELESIPTWPVDSSIRRRFTLRNLGLLIPFVGYIVGQTSFWQQLSKVLIG